MQEIKIGKNQAGQRADKFLIKYLPHARKNFLYKMMRKKNITLNDKKLLGNELLLEGDSVKIYFAEETLNKFRGNSGMEGKKILLNNQNKGADSSKARCNKQNQGYNLAAFKNNIIYEDTEILFMNKPAGILSQKAVQTDVSMNEYMCSYLMAEAKEEDTDFLAFRPSICNRLDRNTTGLLIGGKSLAGLQEMSRVLRERCIHKYYLCIVKGVIQEAAENKISGYLKKEQETNKVTIYDTPQPDADYICTEYIPLGTNGNYTLLKVLLVTGKPHQIRAHLSSIGHPILGDEKYGDAIVNLNIKKQYGVKYQLLHSYCLDFSDYQSPTEQFSYLEGKRFFAEPEAAFIKVLKGEQLHGYLE